MRKQFAKSLTELARKDERILLLTGDVGGELFKEFYTAFPSRFFNIGIAEQSMVGIASGLALQGFRPVVYTVTPFLIERAFEQIKLDVWAQQAPVGLVGYADYPTHGITHRELTPFLLEVMDGLKCFYPRTSTSVKMLLAHGINRDFPWFMSLKKDKTTNQ